MSDTIRMSDADPWTEQQVNAYRQLLPRYSRLAEVVQTLLEKAARSMQMEAIVQTRPKAIPSFTEKAIRKKKAGRYDDPLVRMTDLCGGRVILQTQAEVRAMSEFIETHFIVDAANSVDVSQRLKPAEFGYRSIHYIVQLKRSVFPTRAVAVEIPEELYPDEASPMKAEIQVRTVVEHAWAGFVHDRVYKGAFVVPSKWQRELAVLAGMLELTDQSFARVQAGLRAYAANYGAYLSETQLLDEMNTLESVLACDPDNAGLAYRIGKLAMELGDWEKARDIFNRAVQSNYPPILRDLGVVLCKLHAADPAGADYRQGQDYLERACAADLPDVDALASLAGSWKNLDPDRTRQLYQQAYETDPSDPYAVSNYLVYEIVHQRSLAPAAMLAPSIRAAVQRSRDQVEVGMNIPWAYYNLGIFHLLLGQPYAALNEYMRAISYSNTDWMAETSLRLLERLDLYKNDIHGWEWARRLLILSRAVRFHSAGSLESLRKFASPAVEMLTSPVILFAGGMSFDYSSSQYDWLVDGFKSFQGTLIGGGTAAGVSGLAGRVQEAYPDSIHSIGYLPAQRPDSVQVSHAYRQIVTTDGKDFSALEPLQYWTDLLAAGISPPQVRLLGLGGGEISAFEYRLALTLGAQVGVMEGSGGEADCLLADPEWKNSPNLVRLGDQREEDDFSEWLLSPELPVRGTTRSKGR
jgi:ppGpp synthetase/RelA/SpoT-type nucleotidyltranferase